MTDVRFNPVADVQEFITAFDAKPDWHVLMQEEAKEILEAVNHLAKEFADFMYVTAGNMIANGEDSPLPSTTEIDAAFKWVDELSQGFPEGFLIEVFNRTHASNMSKLDDNGKPIKREDGKILKSKNYKPPFLDDMAVRI